MAPSHRELHLLEKNSRLHRWQFRPPIRARERTIGVLGLVNLGKAIAEALAGDGFQVLGWSITSKSLPNITSYIWSERPRRVGCKC
ncbi:NAD(P)-dependent oxidoreductase [Pseudomonas sp. GV085]|uniref:NAD(P)-dependent oxidoreductase n=1 Tax=unclassified Pseudomonas TaxID=196821 RepID=UPI000D3A8AF1